MINWALAQVRWKVVQQKCAGREDNPFTGQRILVEGILFNNKGL